MADLNFGSVHETTVRSTQTERFIGQIYGESPEIGTAINGYAVATDVWTPATDGTDESSIVFQAPDASSATTYTITASNTLAEIAEALGDSGTDLGRAVTKWFLVNQTTGVCTAKNPGVTGTFTNGTHITWTHTTTGSSGTDLPVGRLVLSQGLSSAPGCAGVPKARLPAASTTLYPTSKQVITFTYASVASGDTITTIIEEPTRSIRFAVSTLYATSHAATLTAHTAALETALNANLGAGYGAVATNSSNDILITTDVKGARILGTSTVSGAGGGTCSVAFTTGGIGSIVSDIVPSILGIVGRRGQSQLNSDGDPVVPPMRLAEIGRRGYAMVANTQSPARGDLCWLDPATGLLYNAGASGYIPLPSERIRWTGVNNSDASAAEVELRF